MCLRNDKVIFSEELINRNKILIQIICCDEKVPIEIRPIHLACKSL